MPGKPHARNWSELAQEAGVDVERGLEEKEAARRLQEHGPNELPQEATPGLWRILGRQFRSLLLWILLAAVAFSVVLGDAIEAVAIAVILVFTVLLGFVQEYRAERAMDALRRMAAPMARVLRDGQVQEVPAPDVVPGDIMVLAQGDIVPADGRLIEVHDFQVAEAALTGESVPVEKAADADVAADAAVGDRANMAFAATTVGRGRARAVVTATGAATEVGHIGRLVAGVEKVATPLEKQLARLGRWLLAAGGAVIALIVVLGIARGLPWQEMLIFGVALAVAAVPEALPAVVTIGLAIGAQRMARRHALVRRLPVVETLGSTTVICTDKTGTLTTGQMAATHAIVAGMRVDVTGKPTAEASQHLEAGFEGEPSTALDTLFLAAALCNEATPLQGEPTEIALLEMAQRAGLDQDTLQKEYPRTDEEPFSSETKRMVTLHGGPRGPVVFAKGSSTAILEMCDRTWSETGIQTLDEAGRQRWQTEADELAGAGTRVLALAFGPDAGMGEALVFLGLVGIRDPPRPEAAKAVATCVAAGMRPILITGDHPGTALAVAHELGLPGDETATGPELEAMDDEALGEVVSSVNVYGRVSPEHKLRIVRALQAQGHVTAMTGDGVNDAPALKQADIGVAMGSGTAVAREAADMTLSNDDFASIVAAVEEGRGIFDNVRKYLVYLLSTNLGELLLIAAAMLLGLPLPLTAVMILYVNLASDGLPALALAVDPPEPDLMERTPRAPGAGVLDVDTMLLMVLGGVWTALAVMGVFLYAQAEQVSTATGMTMALATLVLIQFAMGYSFRTERTSVFNRPFANKWYNIAVAWEVVLLLVVVYTPLLNRLFGTTPLDAGAWLLIVPAALSAIVVLEVAKAVRRWLQSRMVPMAGADQ